MALLRARYESVLGFTPDGLATNLATATDLIPYFEAIATERSQKAGDVDGETRQALVRWQLLQIKPAKDATPSSFMQMIMMDCKSRMSADAVLISKIVQQRKITPEQQRMAHREPVARLSPRERSRQALLLYYLQYGTNNEAPYSLTRGLQRENPDIKRQAQIAMISGRIPELVIDSNDMMAIANANDQITQMERNQAEERAFLAQEMKRQQQEEARLQWLEGAAVRAEQAKADALNRIADALNNR